MRNSNSPPKYGQGQQPPPPGGPPPGGPEAWNRQRYAQQPQNQGGLAGMAQRGMGPLIERMREKFPQSAPQNRPTQPDWSQGQRMQWPPQGQPPQMPGEPQMPPPQMPGEPQEGRMDMMPPGAGSGEPQYSKLGGNIPAFMERMQQQQMPQRTQQQNMQSALQQDPRAGLGMAAARIGALRNRGQVQQ